MYESCPGVEAIDVGPNPPAPTKTVKDSPGVVGIPLE
jgi:hypothetical protein